MERPAPKGKPGPKPRADSGPEPCSREPGSVTPHSQERVNALLKGDDTGLAAREIIKNKAWEISKTGELSEFQAQVIIAVCEGRDEADIQ